MLVWAPMNDVTHHYLISGRVQGVGYRAFAAASARALGVVGWTRNLSDGRVEVLARASAEVLATFVGALRAGPPHGRVDDVVTVEWLGSPESFLSFEQRKDATQPCSAP